MDVQKRVIVSPEERNPSKWKQKSDKLSLPLPAEMSSGGEYDAAFAATIAAAAFAIAAREEKLATQKNPIPIEAVPPALSPVKRAESMKRPGGGSKISRWFSGKEPVEDDDDGPGRLNTFALFPTFWLVCCSKTCKSLCDNSAMDDPFSQRICKEAAETSTWKA